jgi:hypothetical protein
MTDIAFPLWLAAINLFVGVIGKMPKGLALMVDGALIGVGVLGWYFGLTVMVPTVIGIPLSIILISAVFTVVAGRFRQARYWIQPLTSAK